MKKLALFAVFTTSIALVGAWVQLMTGLNIWWNIVRVYQLIGFIILLFNYVFAPSEHFARCRASSTIWAMLSTLSLLICQYDSELLLAQVEAADSPLLWTLWGAVYGTLLVGGMLGTFIGVPRAFAGIAHFNQIERDHKAKRAAIARNEPRVYGHVHQSTGGRRARVTHYERTGEYLETELRDE